MKPIGSAIRPALLLGALAFALAACAYEPWPYPPPQAYAVPPPRAYAAPPPQAYAAPAPAAAQDCQDYQSQIVIDGKPQQVHGTACRQPDGRWRIVN
jgi:hypothetical protein